MINLTPNIVFIGDKEIREYVEKTIFKLATSNISEVVIKARGNKIGKAVEVYERVYGTVSRKNLNFRVEKGNISTLTEMMESNRKKYNVTAIELVLKKS